jgi:hypothetical protein
MNSGNGHWTIVSLLACIHIQFLSIITAGFIPGEGHTLLDLEDADTTGRIPHGYRTILGAAIFGTPSQKLSISEIRGAIMRRYPDIFAANDGTWQVHIDLHYYCDIFTCILNCFLALAFHETHTMHGQRV